MARLSYRAMNVLLCLLLCYLEILPNTADDSQAEQHHTSCLTLDDGIHYIRPGYDNRFPSIKVHCESGWAILDYTIDANIRYYFSSFKKITDNIASMDTVFERKNWNHWLQVKEVKYAVSEDCNTCAVQSTDDYNKAYYMTGNYYGCNFATQVLCDMNTETDECYQCALSDPRYHFATEIKNDASQQSEQQDENQEHVQDEAETLYNGACTHVVLDVTDPDINQEWTTQKRCSEFQFNYLPSIGLNGKYCTCFKPKSEHVSDDWMVNAVYLRDDIDLFDEPQEDSLTSGNQIDIEPQDLDCNSIVHELTNSDFEHGTYRIRRCGTYKLTEDIVLNMNAPSEAEMEMDAFSPNDVIKYYWYPTWQQQADENEYPSKNLVGPYSLGFFAGISVEAQDVVIDLNGYEMKMDDAFYLQQRFFSLIELASKPFIDGQGPSNWGTNNEQFASNVVIKNGVLSLTSHSCIHGNNNENVVIQDIKCRDFEVSGITMNGFHGLTIENVEVGPNNQNIPLMPNYAFARAMLSRLELIDDKVNKFVFIGNVRYTADEIINSLQHEMDQAFAYSYNQDTELVDQDEIDRNIFINKDGLPRGGTLYGIFLNSIGFSSFGLGLSPGYSTDLVLKNIKVVNLRSNPTEVVRLKEQRGPFYDVFDIKSVVNVEGMYAGNVYSNAQFALNKLVEDRLWSVLGNSFMTDELKQWIVDKRNPIRLSPLKCNSDAMLQQTKGIFGIRIDNVQNVQIEGDIQIQRLHNLGEFGESAICGKYYDADSGGHTTQHYPLQVGYTGNEVHAISFIGADGVIKEDANIEVDNLLSARSNVYGIQFYPNSNMRIHSNVHVNINNVHAGAFLKGTDLLKLKQSVVPNTVPRVCLFDVWTADGGANKHENVQFVGEDIQVQSECVTQYTSCSFAYWKVDDSYSYGDVLNDDYVKESEVNNGECVFDVEKTSVISLLSEQSEYEKQSLHLLNMQLNTNTEMKTRVAVTVIEKNTLHILVIVCIIIMIMCGIIMVYCHCFRYSNEPAMKQPIDMDFNEQSPLIALH